MRSVSAVVKIVGLVLPLVGIAACSSVSQKHVAPKRSVAELAKIPDAAPKNEPRSKRGNMRTYEVYGKKYYVLDSSKGFRQKGIASWYGPKFHGKTTSNGEIYDMYAMTAAHKTLPLPSYLEVRNLENGRKIIVRVNDRGPFHNNRIVDLSYTAAIKLDMIATGTALVEIRAINPRTYRRGGRPVTARPGTFRKNKREGGAPVYTRPTTFGKNKALDFYIQVGVFSDYNNAARLKDKLLALETPIRVEETTLNGEAAFRVTIGPLNDTGAADKIVHRLGRFDIHDHRILTQ